MLILDSLPDVYSSTHAEALASGCISIGGGHPLFQGRPGVAGLRTVSDYVHTVDQPLSESEEQRNQRQKSKKINRYSSGATSLML